MPIIAQVLPNTDFCFRACSHEHAEHEILAMRKEGWIAHSWEATRGGVVVCFTKSEEKQLVADVSVFREDIEKALETALQNQREARDGDAHTSEPFLAGAVEAYRYALRLLDKALL